MIQDIMAIDTHTHINHGSRFDTKPNDKMYTATLDNLKRINDAAHIGKMCCSTFSSVLATEEIEQENRYMFDLVQKEENLYQWVVIDPRIPNTFAQAEEMLAHPKCVGIKLHPVYHQYCLADYARPLFSFAAERKAIVQIHPDTAPELFVPTANRYPDVTFILAHLGTESYAKAIAMAEYGNIYTDTSGGASTQNWVVEYTVDKVGSQRILFGTDTYAAGFQRGRIDYALISEEDKENILVNNARRLFGL